MNKTNKNKISHYTFYFTVFIILYFTYKDGIPFILNWDNLDEKTVNILTFKKCENNNTDKKYPLITNCDPKYESDDIINCNVCIEPFYKKITWNNPIEGATQKDLSEISTIVYTLINLLKDQSRNLKYSKYLKYKNKYLELKKSLAKN